MATVAAADRRERELWRRLGEVNDPELDEPVTEMGFVERAAVAGDGRVEVDFRLPTYWCSPNFAFLMLDGIREVLETLSWAPVWRVRLHDHMFADEVNSGVEAGKSFGEIFGGLSEDADLGALRGTFAQKAFKRRQEAVVLGLRRQGLIDREILDMDLTALDAVHIDDEEAARQVPRYREALLRRWPGRKPDQPVFVTWEGAPIRPEVLAAYLAELRSIRISMEFNGTLCRGLKNTRYKEMDIVDGEPTLVDFMLDRVPPADCPRQASRD